MNRIIFFAFCMMSAKIFGQVISIAPNTTLNLSTKPQVFTNKQMQEHFKATTGIERHAVEGYKDDEKIYKIGNTFVDFEEINLSDQIKLTL